MKMLLCLLIFFCSSLISLAGHPLLAELIAPADPVVLDPKAKPIFEASATALKERQDLEKRWQADPKAKPDFKRLRELEDIINKARTLKQGINLTLRLTNKGNKAITIAYGGDTSTNTLEITGPGALNLEYRGPMTMDYRQGKPTVIAPGKSVEFQIEDLHHGQRNMSRWVLTKPGNYVIKVAFRANIGNEQINIASTGITLEVKE